MHLSTLSVSVGWRAGRHRAAFPFFLLMVGTVVLRCVFRQIVTFLPFHIKN